MKLLIDIPEHIYEHAKEMSEDSRDEGEAMRAIAKGSPQESCGDVISRQAVIDAMYELCSTGETLKENPWRDNPHIDAITDAIENLPSVSPQQVLDKIRAEIAVLDDADYDYEGYYKAITDAVKIIDRYKAEGSEE